MKNVLLCVTSESIFHQLWILTVKALHAPLLAAYELSALCYNLRLHLSLDSRIFTQGNYSEARVKLQLNRGTRHR